MESRFVTAPVTPVCNTFSILVVCTANICRSPMVEYLLRAELAKQTTKDTIDFVVSSAGVRGWDASEMDPDAAMELRTLGGDPTDFRSKQLTTRDIETADLILTAGREHRAFVLEQEPRALRRTYTILEFAHLIELLDLKPHPAGDPRQVVATAFAHRGDVTLASYDIEDPYGRPGSKQHDVASVIATACITIASGLAS